MGGPGNPNPEGSGRIAPNSRSGSELRVSVTLGWLALDSNTKLVSPSRITNSLEAAPLAVGGLGLPSVRAQIEVYASTSCILNTIAAMTPPTTGPTR